MKTKDPNTDPLHKRNPYQVPDGYFSDLRNNIMGRVAEQQEETRHSNAKGGLWAKLKGTMGLTAAFGSLVLFALTGFYFTGYQAQIQENTMAGQEIFLGYNLNSLDIETLLYDLDGTYDEVEVAEIEQHFNEAVNEYLQTFGHSKFTDVELLSDAGYTMNHN